MTPEIILPPCPNEKVPAAQVRFHHRVDCQTRFNDFDIFGHLNNTIYMAFLDLGKARYYTDVLGNVFNLKGTSAVIVNTNISFCSPTYMEEPLCVLTLLARVAPQLHPRSARGKPRHRRREMLRLDSARGIRRPHRHRRRPATGMDKLGRRF